jgi:FKBP-type peptidyl-prolyl cis-trans isomerase
MRAINRRGLTSALAAATAILFVGAIETSAPAVSAETTTTASGVKVTDTKAGTGAEATPGQTVTVHYTGWLDSGGGVKGFKFDSSLDRGQPFDFKLGAGQVIKGWDDGVAGMKVGGKRTLIIPPELGYGGNGAGNVIPPNATLIFDVELLGVK